MLSAQLALRAQPVVELTFARNDNLKRLQRDVVEALRLVVGVNSLQLSVEDVGKLADVLRLLRKLDEPLVAALRVGVHEHRRRRVLLHLCAGLLAGIGEALLGVVLDKLLAESVDEILRSARYHELVRAHRRELHRVANHIAPQTARRADKHSVVLARLHALKRHDVRVLRVELVHRQELVEHVVVEHQQHRLVRRVVLYAEESLRGVVRLHVVHAVALYDVLVLRAVGRERDAAVEEHLQVGPHLVEALLARQLEHAHQHAEHP